MTAHRYWRILARNNGGGTFTGVTEMQMRTTSGGSNVASGGTPISTGTIQSGSAANVFDGDTTTTQIQWSGNAVGTGLSVGYDFGSGNNKDIVELVLWPDKDGANRMFTEFDVQSSDDNATWNTEWVCTYNAWAVGTSVTFTKPTGTSHRYWRIRPTAQMDGASAFGIAECDMRSAVNGSDLCSGGTASARTTFSGTSAAGAFANDGTTSIYSSATSTLGSEWLQYDFGSGNDKDVVEIWIQTRNDSSWRQGPTAGYVESSPDGRNFLIRWAFSGICYGQNSISYIEKPGAVTPPSSGHRYWGIRTTVTVHGSVAGLREIELHASIGGTDQTGSGIALADNCVFSAAPVFAFDNGAGEYASAALPAIIVYDFGVGNELSIAEIVMTARSSTTNNFQQAPTDFDIIYGDVNGSWTTALSFTGQAPWSALETRTFGPISAWVPKVIIC